jgi:hypothetical protein
MKSLVAPRRILLLFTAPAVLDRTAVQQEFLGKGGLTGIRVADDGESAPMFDLFVQGHGWSWNVRSG